jgi:hypothetical protein
MGLDTTAMIEFKDGEHVPAPSEMFDGTEGLTRGIMAWGNADLRGKVYSHMVEQISGISLYQETINNKAVRDIADSLQDFVDYPEKYRDLFFTYDLKRKEVIQLVKWFKIAADNGCYLRGWW